MALNQGNQGQTGKVLGNSLTASFGEYQETLVTELHARYYQNVYRGNVFNATNGSAIATAGGFTTGTQTPFTLYNPAGSGKNLVILEIISTLALPAAPTGATYQLWLGACLTPTQAAPGLSTATALTIHNALLGFGTNALALAYSAVATPSVPVPVRNLGAVQMLTNTSAGTYGIVNTMWFKDETAGALIVAPGVLVTLGTSTACSAIATMTWAELPV